MEFQHYLKFCSSSTISKIKLSKDLERHLELLNGGIETQKDMEELAKHMEFFQATEIEFKKSERKTK